MYMAVEKYKFHGLNEFIAACMKMCVYQIWILRMIPHSQQYEVHPSVHHEE